MNLKLNNHKITEVLCSRPTHILLSNLSRVLVLHVFHTVYNQADCKNSTWPRWQPSLLRYVPFAICCTSSAAHALGDVLRPGSAAPPFTGPSFRIIIFFDIAVWKTKDVVLFRKQTYPMEGLTCHNHTSGSSRRRLLSQWPDDKTDNWVNYCSQVSCQRFRIEMTTEKSVFVYVHCSL